MKIRSLCNSPNCEYIIAGFADGPIMIWKDDYFNYNFKNKTLGSNSKSFGNRMESIPSFQFYETLTEHKQSVRSVASAYLNIQNQSDMVIVSGSQDRTIRIWDLESKNSITAQQEALIFGVAISTAPEQKLIACVGNDKYFKLLNTQGVSIKTIDNDYKDEIRAVTFCSFHANQDNSFHHCIEQRNERIITHGDDQEGKGTVCLFDTETGNLMQTMQAKHEGLGWRAVVTNCNRYVISCALRCSKIIVHDLQYGGKVREIKTDHKGLEDIKILGHDLIVTTSKEVVQVWNRDTTRLLKTFQSEEDANVVVGGDKQFGRWIASGGTKTIKIWSE